VIRQLDLTIFCCVKCERKLFTPINILRISKDNNDSVFLERMTWMESLIENEGIIKCTQCTEQIGQYNWNEEGQQGLPAFKVHKDKIVQKSELFTLEVNEDEDISDFFSHAGTVTPPPLDERFKSLFSK